MDEVAAGRDSNSIGVRFLRSEIYNYACICDRSIPRDVLDLVMGEDEVQICTRCARLLVALCLISKFLTKRVHPDFFGDGVPCQLFVAGDEFSSSGMCDWCAEVCDILWELLRWAELVGREGRYIGIPCRLSDQVECLLGD